jgi:GNAT superfamily N-acetyltransferase
MTLSWIRENPPHWDDKKAAIIGGAPPGIFKLPDWATGALLPGEWWRVEDDGHIVGYGWMDAVWGDAEVLLAVEPGKRKQGVGTFIMDHLEQEARGRGLNHLYNSVLPSHPEREQMTRWLEKRAFRASEDGSVLRRVVTQKHG